MRAGEIVGIAGVDANGQSELIEAITGLRDVESGTITVDGQDITGAARATRSGAGVGHIAEDRHRRGLVLSSTSPRTFRCASTAARTWAAGCSRRARSPTARASCSATTTCAAATPTRRASSLSGGNQQKVVIARELSADPKLLIAAQPTRGLDVGAIEFVHRRLVEERDKGRAILLISLELEEVRSLSDRVLVIYEGEIVTELPPDASEEEFGVFMTGGGRKETAA